MNIRCITKVRKITQHRHTKRGNYDEWVSFVDEWAVFADKNREEERGRCALRALCFEGACFEGASRACLGGAARLRGRFALRAQMVPYHN